MISSGFSHYLESPVPP